MESTDGAVTAMAVDELRGEIADWAGDRTKYTPGISMVAVYQKPPQKEKEITN